MPTNVTTANPTQPIAATALAAAFTLGSILLAFIFFRLLCRLSNLPKSLQPQDPTPIYIRLALQFGLLLSLALRVLYFVLVAFYSEFPDKNHDILRALHHYNDLVGIVVLSVIMVFVAIVVDRLFTYWIRSHLLEEWWENLVRGVRCVALSGLLVMFVIGVVFVLFDDILPNKKWTCENSTKLPAEVFFTTVFALTDVFAVVAIIGVMLMGSNESVLRELLLSRAKLMVILCTILMCYIINFLLVLELPSDDNTNHSDKKQKKWPYKAALSPCVFYDPSQENTPETTIFALVYYGLEIVYFAVVSVLMTDCGNLNELLSVLELRNRGNRQTSPSMDTLTSTESAASQPDELGSSSNFRLLYRAMKEDKARARDNWIIRPTNVTKQRKLFSGGEAQIFVGNYFGSRVALKEILASYMYNDLEGLVREAKLLKQIKHPNVVTFFGICIDQERYFLVEEYLPRTLVDLLRDLRAPENQRQTIIFVGLSVAMQLCSALQYLHSLKILHLDVKPDNVLISENQIRLCDFGFSRRLDKGGSVTVSKTHGTPGYAAPELSPAQPTDDESEDSVRITTAADVFSFGMLMWQLFTDDDLQTVLLGPLDALQSEFGSQPPPLPPISTSARKAMDQFALSKRDQRAEGEPLLEQNRNSQDHRHKSHGSRGSDGSMELSSPSSGFIRLMDANKGPRFITLYRIQQGLRPKVSAWCPVCIHGIIRSCWHQDEAKRPAFSVVSSRLADAAHQLSAPDLNDMMLTSPSTPVKKAPTRARRTPAMEAAQKRSSNLFKTTKSSRRRALSHHV